MTDWQTPRYFWRGLDAQGHTQEGLLQAHDAELARAHLRRQGILVKSLQRQWWTPRETISARALTASTRQWATLIRAGVSVVPALQMLQRSASSTTLARLLGEVRTDVENGSALSVALARHPSHFNALFVSMVQAGESAGILDVMMERLAQTLEKNEALSQRMRSALTYPVVVSAIALGVLVLLMVLVVPVFEDVFRSFGAPLPWSTQFIVSLSQAMTTHGLWLLLGALVLGLLVRQQWQQQTFWQRQWHRRLLALPGLGKLISTAASTRWAHTLSALLAAGVPLSEALGTAGQASHHPVYERLNEHLMRRVVQGGRLSEGMAHSGRFPDLLVQLCATGEETGTLDSLLARAADLLSDELNARISALSSLVEPLIIVVLGGAIGVILVAMYLPIFRLGQVF